MRSPKYPMLDGLRAVAVIAVIVFHIRKHYLPSGFLGVDLFFVVSGFLITGLLLREWESTGTLRLGAFVGRRAVRLLPALVVLLLFLAVTGEADPAQICAALFYYANWFAVGGGDLGTLLHTWSLSVEEQFYLVWPVVLLVSWRLTRDRFSPRAVVASWAAAGLLVSLAVRVAAGLTVRGEYGTDARMGALFAGVLLTIASPWLRHRSAGAWVRAGGGLCLAGLFAMMTVGEPTMWQAILTPFVCAGVVAMATLPHGLWIVGPVLNWGPVRWIGQISYGLYLWHFPLYKMLPLGMSPLVRTALVCAVTLAAATASFYLVEQPVSRKIRPLLR